MSIPGDYSPKNIGLALIEARNARLEQGKSPDAPAASIIAGAQILLDPTEGRGSNGNKSLAAAAQHDHAFVTTFRSLRDAFGLSTVGRTGALRSLPPKQQQEALMAFAYELISVGGQKS